MCEAQLPHLVRAAVRCHPVQHALVRGRGRVRLTVRSACLVRARLRLRRRLRRLEACLRVQPQLERRCGRLEPRGRRAVDPIGEPG